MFDIMLTDNESGPLYKKLYCYFRGLIEDGALQNGAKLPSVRAVRQQLHVSKSTVDNAYQLLIADGYVYSKPRSGFIVVQPATYSSMRVKSALRFDPADASTPAISAMSANAGDSMIDFSLLNVDHELFPAKAWRSALTEAAGQYSSTLHEYGDSRGEYQLRSRIAQYLHTSRGVNCEPEQIVIGSGFSYCLFVLRKLWQRGGEVAIEQSSIAQVGEFFLQHGFTFSPTLIMNDSDNDEESGLRSVQAVYITPSHRPAGRPLTNEKKERLLQWAVRHDAYIIEDDYDGEFQYRGKPVPSLQGADQHGVVIYIGTFSKAFTPALRMNYMVLPQRMVPRLEEMRSILSSPSRMDQLAMSVFMERGHWYRHIKRIRKRYGVKRQILIKLIETELSPWLSVKDDGIGVHIEATIAADRDANEFIRLAAEQGVRVYGAQHNGSGAAGKDSDCRIYLGFGGVSVEQMEQGIMRLKEAWVHLLIKE